ncbi:MAG: ATP-binding protein [Planctomycetes bacterium]|nr:ATP-binding protein [Planctomycetota bacterium]
MHGRHITPQILAALTDTPAVFLQGPRQAGKSTLVQSLRDQGHDAPYVTLDDAAELASAMRDSDAFVDALPERVILDEVQRAPGIFRSLKRRIDRRRVPGQFLLTGSANALLLPKVSESLAGRVELLRLYPLSQGEIGGVVEAFVDACFSDKFVSGRFPGSGWPSLVERIVRGGFPDAVGRPDDERRRAWFSSYTTSLIERDVRDVTNVHALHELPRLFQLLAARSACVLNVSDLARDAGFPVTTLQRHMALLHAIFFATTIPAWSGNLSSRVTKAPKVLLFDTGLLCNLLKLDANRLRTDELMSGAVLETFVATELIKQATWSHTRPWMFHFRTPKQHEVDIVLEDARGRVVGIEVKKTASPNSDDFRGLRELAEAAGKKFVRGIVLYTGESAVGFGPNLYAVPVSALWGTKRVAEKR